jgi:hypothetical protein
VVLPWWQGSTCVLGDVHDSMKGKSQVLDVWLVFIGIILTHMEVVSFEEIGFCLPRHAHATQARVGNPNLDDMPISKHDNKCVHHVPPRG